ncbi:MAG TPA: Asp-tRNA(Asn)/Glu-tRNA(Gln) amidotransferase subunit GatA [Candidatus Sulfotelmatobacter sp.]|jgi:aspartyl-tRNA(Asn)/glutamyl-tRNA(Gln) amidotransferase subunit A|nr:Asp-tRNA(Asn)/Glu-tRNA(Gln) amidotransferase subunit GatA [Candidatus Sulfotelmatobacter sp.]
MDIKSLTIKQAKQDLKDKKYSSVELTEAYLERIKQVESKVKAYVTITNEEALQNAKEADEKIAKGLDLPLLGIPLSIKDNFSTKGIRTTASSKVLDSYIPPFDATVVGKLKNAGMVLLGKTNMDAWAHGSSTETSDYGPSKNPWNIDYLPGGSSGGAAASVAADETIAAIGSETAGSIRQPASWCGIVGLKPTYGRVSRYGIVAMGSSLDSPGPLTKTVEDSALILQVLAGKDPHDATTGQNSVPDYRKNLANAINGLILGVADDYFEGVTPEVKESVENALKTFEKLGAKLKKIHLFSPKYAIAVYTILQRAEVSSNLARYDGIRYGNDRSYLGDEAKRRIMLGTYTLSAGYYDQYYNKALKVRTVIIEDFKQAFNNVDLIIGPTSPTTALPIGASEDQSMFGELADVLVEPSSIAGLAGINVPCGFSKAGLPIGMQIIGPQFSEEKILNTAHKYQQENPLYLKKPNL